MPHPAVAVIPLLAFFAATTHAQGTSYKHPQTGRECVSEAGAERTSGGTHVHVHFQNICDRTFSVRIQPGNGSDTRGTGIGPGSPGRPSKMYITCRAADLCESGKWFYK